VFAKQKFSYPAFILSVIIGFVFYSGMSYGQKPVSLPGLMDDVQRLAGKSNKERLLVLQNILSEKQISYSVESFSTINERNGKKIQGDNIVVTLGSGSTDIVIGAHYDKVDVGSGLIDNGCSALILTRLAESLRSEELNHRIRIVFFDQEETGLNGSAQFIKAHEGDPIVSMINLDVNAYGDMTMMGPSGSTGINRLYRLAQSICVENDFNFTVFPIFGGSDDISFQRAGIENISIGSAPAQEAYQFWLKLNAEDEFKPPGMPKVFTMIHSNNDSIDVVDPAAMTRIYFIVLEMVKRLDKTD
jgi:hypothetical protein